MARRLLWRSIQSRQMEEGRDEGMAGNVELIHEGLDRDRSGLARGVASTVA